MSKLSHNDIEILKREIDHWIGKFSVETFLTHIVKMLNGKKISKGTFYNLMKDYPEIKERVESARERYRDEKANGSTECSNDKLLNESREKITKLKSEVHSLKSENERLKEKIIQMLYNAYYEKVSIENLKRPVKQKEAIKVLSDRNAHEKVAFLDKPLPPK